MLIIKFQELMSVKRIILVSISLFSLFTFASDLKGKWARSGFVCRLQDNQFTEIGVPPAMNSIFEFKENNKVVKAIGAGGCILISLGTYTIKGNRLDVLLEEHYMHKLYPEKHYLCGRMSDDANLLSYEFILKDSSLYVRDSSFGDLLIQECTDGAVFEQFIQKKL